MPTMERKYPPTRLPHFVRPSRRPAARAKHRSAYARVDSPVTSTVFASVCAIWLSYSAFGGTTFHWVHSQTICTQCSSRLTLILSFVKPTCAFFSSKEFVAPIKDTRNKWSANRVIASLFTLRRLSLPIGYSRTDMMNVMESEGMWASTENVSPTHTACVT